jgi:hypothetical protein
MGGAPSIDVTKPGIDKAYGIKTGESPQNPNFENDFYW